MKNGSFFSSYQECLNANNFYFKRKIYKKQIEKKKAISILMFSVNGKIKNIEKSKRNFELKIEADSFTYVFSWKFSIIK